MGTQDLSSTYKDFDGLGTAIHDWVAPPRANRVSIHADLDSPGQPTTIVGLRKLDTEGVDDGFIDAMVYP